MRSVLAISVPAPQKEAIEKRAKKARKTVSAYVIDALNIMEQMISEDELAAMAKTAEKNYKKGKTRELKSLADLIKKRG